MPEQPAIDLVSTYDGRHADAEAAPGLIIPTHIVSTEWVSGQEIARATRQPDFGPINQIHRGHAGYISFAVMDDWGDWIEPFSIPAKDLMRYRYLPTLMPILSLDSFYTINGQQFPAYKDGRPQLSQFALGPRGGKLPLGRHSKANTQYLTACWTDIDCYNLNLEVGTVIGEVINAEKAGRIPRVSVVINSGGGVWLLWLVCDIGDRDRPPRAYKSLVNFWGVIQRTIHARFAQYGADPHSASDVSRYCRVPNSSNTKWKEPVEYWFHVDGSNGKVFTYTLPELANWFDVPPPRSPKEKKRLPKPSGQAGDKDPVKQAAGAKGYVQRWQYDLDDFYTLWNLRGTFPPGQRNFAVRVFVKAMKGTKQFTFSEIWEAAQELYDSFEQPPGNRYHKASFKATVASVLSGPLGRKRSLKRADIADALVILPEEAAMLQKFPAASRFEQSHKPIDAGLTKTEARAIRREAEKKIVAGLDGVVPTIQEMIELLRVQHGLEVASTETVHRDYKKLGFDKLNPRSHKPPPPPPAGLF